MSDSLNNNSPIQSAVDAIHGAIKSRSVQGAVTIPKYRCFLDWDKGSLENLASEIIEISSNENPEKFLFIETPFGNEDKREYKAWITLLQSVIRKTSCGIAAGIDDVVDKLIQYTPILQSYIKTVNPSGLYISPWETPEDAKQIMEARHRLLSWAQMEVLSDVDYVPIFSSLVGGLRPLVVVFDDYNNYIRHEGGVYFTALSEQYLQNQKIKERYGCDINEFHRFVSNHCKNLNNLSISCDVHAYKVWISNDRDALFRQVADALPFELLESTRGRIGAFLVDLEWRPTIWREENITDNGSDNDWSGMGYRAIHLLSQRFTEIPCFVYTGHWSESKLQEALAHGAKWCFYKESHHGYVPKEDQQVTCLEFVPHLQEAARMMHGAFSELPFPDQLILDTRESASRQLLKKLGLRLPISSSPRGRNLQRIVAKLFPSGDEIRPIKVFSSGKSKAQAAFVARPSRNGIPFAARFLKVAPWLEIQREYLAYNRVIRPRLNTYVGNIVESPVLAGGIQGEMPLGVIAYTMAGLPEGYANLIPLDELIRKQCPLAGGGQLVAQRLSETLEKVLLHLYGEDGEKNRKVRRPLWGWLGEVLPPAFTGVLVSLERLDDGVGDTFTARSWLQQEFKDSTGWLMAAGDAREIREKATLEKNLSPWNLKGNRIKLDGFYLREIEWGNDRDTGEITLAHPDMGWRIRLRGCADDIRRRFGAIWVRPGFSLDVSVIVEKENREFETIKRRLSTAFGKTDIDTKPRKGMTISSVWLDGFAKAADAGSLADPFELFDGEKQIPYSFTISAHQMPVHGDLNLHNILFSGESGPGWLIDFERSDLRGMSAFDLAKLEVEIWHHHIFPLFGQIASGTANETECCLKLLQTAQMAVDANSVSGEIFVSLVRTRGIIKEATDGLLLPVCNLLIVIATVRKFGRERLKLDESELHWALAAYFFSATKFATDKQHWRAVFSFLASARCLGAVAPRHKQNNFWTAPLDTIKSEWLDTTDDQEIDGLLLKISQDPIGLDEFTRAMAKSRDEFQVKWPKEFECWDLASTGSITNITPIFGYLWLMVKAQQEKKQGAYKVVVPKISSRGKSCGTVDILESGGLNFPSNPDAIVESCRQTGGVLCRQQESTTPIDTALMKRRKETNTMKNVVLVYASILAKKIAMGCTRAIVDVKVGRDTKILAPWMMDEKNRVDKNKMWLRIDETRYQGSHLLCPDMGEPFIDLLQSNKMISSEAKLGDCGQWIEQTCSGSLSPLKEVRWFFTNSDMPQCRAIGRQLTLLHLDDLILGTYGEILLKDNKMYRELYKDFMPNICDVNYTSGRNLWSELQGQWRRLKAQLTRLDDFACIPFFDELKKVRDLDCQSDHHDGTVLKYLKVKNYEKSLNLAEDMDLKVATFALGSYLSSSRIEQQIRCIDAWRLDAFFDWLCGDEDYDPEVGIYLHFLPGEKMKKPHKDPFISVFYRPSRCRESEVIHRMRKFLNEGVQLVQSTGIPAKPNIRPE